MLSDWVVRLIEQSGYLGVAFLMFVETLFPPLPSEVSQYHDDVHRRLLVRPGLTGLWQVSGRSGLSWDEAVRLDLYYVDNWSMTSDLVILFKTVRAVIGKTGAY